MSLRAEGISVDVPPGWDARMFHRPRDPLAPQARGSATPQAPELAVLHAGNFALPTQLGDFGSGAVEIMRATHVLLCLLEYDAPSAKTVLFSHDGVPQSISPTSFRPQTMQRTIMGQSGMQTFFREQGRAFCLYVALGSHRARYGLVPQVNSLLASVRVEPR